jgi:hypothetical protein
MTPSSSDQLATQIQAPCSSQLKTLRTSELLCFLDAYSGYHEIKMALEDQEKTSSITTYDNFSYTSMPLDLKNASATYQRCMQKCLHDQIGINVHAYVDDIMVKSAKKVI